MSETEFRNLENRALDAFLSASNACMHALTPGTVAWSLRERLCECAIDLQAAYARHVAASVRQRVRNSSAALHEAARS